VVSAFNSTHLIFGISSFWPNQKLLRKLTKNYKLFTKTPLINCTQPQTNLWQCIAVICQRVSEEKPNQTTKIHVVSAVWGCVLIDKSAARSEVFTRGENMKSEMWMDVYMAWSRISISHSSFHPLERNFRESQVAMASWRGEFCVFSESSDCHRPCLSMMMNFICRGMPQNEQLHLQFV